MGQSVSPVWGVVGGVGPMGQCNAWRGGGREGGGGKGGGERESRRERVGVEPMR